MEPDGSLVLAYDVSDTKLAICTIGLGKRTCGHVTDLKPPSNADHPTDGGTPEVFVTSANHVVVLQQTCCDTNPDGGDVLYTSTDGGKVFSGPVRIGSLSVNSAALAGGNIVFTDDDAGNWQVEGVSAGASGPPATIATIGSSDIYSTAVGDYKGGALVASTQGNTNDNAYVKYAPKGSDFDSSSSYSQVGKFDNESVIAMSGSALLTIQTKHGSAVRLRLFNGHGFGSAHAVPHDSGGGPQWFTVVQAPDGHVYVFSERAGYKTYDLIEESTSNGSKWSNPIDLGDAVDSSYFSGAVNNSGKGLVLGTDPAIGYPVG